jgi:hypothetical protein
VGDRIAHDIRRTVTETDNLIISTLTHNPQPLHLDAEYASATEFGRIVVNGTFTFALMVGLSVGDTTLGTLVANLGYDKVIMPKPVFIGDTLADQVMEPRRRNPPNAGMPSSTRTQPAEEIVCQCLRMALLKGPRNEIAFTLVRPGNQRRMEKPPAQVPMLISITRMLLRRSEEGAHVSCFFAATADADVRPYNHSAVAWRKMCRFFV